LLINPDTPKTAKVTLESFQSITRWRQEILQRPSLIEHAQLPPRPMLNVARQLS